MGTENLKIRIFRKGNIPYVIIVLGIFSLAPFFSISQYNHPSADDFVLGVKHTELLPQIVKHYNHRNGRYFQTIVAKINPLRYDSFTMFKIFPIVLICLFMISLILMIHHMFWKYFTGINILAISSLLIFLFFFQMPSTAEGFFWFSAYITYMVPTIFTFCLILFLLKAISTNSTIHRIGFTAISSILCIAIIGSNVISLLIADMIIFFFYINHILVLKRNNGVLLFLLIVCLISSIIEIIAPGNYIRFATYEYSGSFTWTIFGSLFLTVTSIVKWSIPIIIASFFYSIYWGIPFAIKNAEAKTPIKIDFRLSIISYIGLIYLLTLIHVWATGYNPAGRVSNVIYLVFIIGWFFNLQLLLIKKFSNIRITKTKITDLLLLTSLLLLLLMPFDPNYNILTAHIDLISGKAKKYDIELKNRYQLINSCKTDTCAVPALLNIPRTIFYVDIERGTYVQNFNNKVYSKYFDKSHIYLNSENPDIKSNQETLKEFGKKKRKKWFEAQKKNENL